MNSKSGEVTNTKALKTKSSDPPQDEEHDSDNRAQRGNKDGDEKEVERGVEDPGT
eukprot:CAMPEP_0172598462 /NCGR_PEP_ID=MMETSP1068-20121228/18503_1 /TAXON_ID=35684 /ORGANISM="Pseudopedinella elastica, Strain CCMP716" /LENGTH=54 /DNA_ID=CAMNT_0013398349 /DNA_START=816 /DNA_END=982 /DNA_ORIENTATION=+